MKAFDNGQRNAGYLARSIMSENACAKGKPPANGDINVEQHWACLSPSGDRSAAQISEPLK
jgi:hypothetical protein